MVVEGQKPVQPVLAADGTPIVMGAAVLVEANVLAAGNLTYGLPRPGDQAVVALEYRLYDGGAGGTEPKGKICVPPGTVRADLEAERMRYFVANWPA